MSRLGLGTVKFGRNQKLKYPKAFELPSKRVVEDLMETAEEQGVNWIDTAPAYGVSEERVGELLLCRRKHFVISTKVGEEFEQGNSRYDLSPKHVEMSIFRSLQRLKTDYLDIVLVHCDANEEILDCLQHFKELGLIRYVGVSVQTEKGIGLLHKTDLVMLSYGLFHKVPALFNGAILIKKPLSSGYDRNPRKTLNFLLGEPRISGLAVGTLSRTHLLEAARCLRTFSN